MKTVKKTFKTLKELEKFISENTLPGAEVIKGQLLVKYQEAEEEDLVVDVASLANKAAVVAAIKEKAEEAGITISEGKEEELGSLSRNELNAFYDNEENFAVKG